MRGWLTEKNERVILEALARVGIDVGIDLDWNQVADSILALVMVDIHYCDRGRSDTLAAVSARANIPHINSSLDEMHTIDFHDFVHTVDIALWQAQL